MTELNRGERLQIMLTDEELKAVDDWRFARRMPSRASAVRELLKRGLAAEGFEVSQPNARSRDYGVVEAGREPGDTDGHSRAVSANG
jgi:hypothetical protein